MKVNAYSLKYGPTSWCVTATSAHRCKVVAEEQCKNLRVELLRLTFAF
jgi:hypothetical protein